MPITTTMTDIMVEVASKLRDIGGSPPLKQQIYRIKSALNWRDPAAANRIRHLVHKQQRATPEQVDQIRFAHARHLIQKMRDRSAEDRALLESIKDFLEIAQRVDSDYYQPVIQEIGELIGTLRDTSRGCGVVD